MFESRARFGATPEKVERALEFSTEVSDLIDRYHPDSIPAGRPQTAIAMTMFMQTLEHRQAIMLLVHHGARSSAAALIRPTFEAYFRGIWALKVATIEQIQNMLGDHPRVPTLDTVLQQLRKNEATRHLADYDSWKASGGYVHSGALQLSRWLSPGGIEPLHPDSDAIDMLELSDFCGLLACIGMNEACGRQPPELEAKLTEHTLRRLGRRAVAAYYGSEDACHSESES
ncbi:hypothetical protein AB4Y43_24620 [Paraburkholderia sp. BR10872]|uniref:DUF6988 family protein n=1 Tax=Paraburkholderia sp. BR10872 TaxID=3236989 RepID=UPI0034D289B5